MSDKKEKVFPKTLKEVKEANPGDKIFEIETYIDGDDDQPRVIYVKKPSRKVRGICESLYKRSPSQANETLFKGMYLGGDDMEEIMKNDEAYDTALEEMAHIIQIKKGKSRRV